MGLERKFILLAAMPVMGLVFPLAAYFLIRFTPALTGMEEGILAFAPSEISITRRQPRPASGMVCPVRAVSSIPQPAMPEAAPLGTVAVVQGEGNETTGIRASLILVSNKRRMAVVDGQVVKEGDSFKGGRVVRIEQKGVLLKTSKGEQWIRTE